MSTLLAILIIVSPLLLGMAALYMWVEYFQHRIGVTPVEEPMLRAPGESQRKRIEELNDAILTPLMAATFPIFAVTLIWQKNPTDLSTNRFLVIMMFGLSAIVIGMSGRRLIKVFRELRNRRLGYAGECLVAEQLLPLHKTDCLIFHDCPADKHGNLDHIVVTPLAVYAIETKTRRKRMDDERGAYANQVTYDGRSLHNPWGREDFSLDQARRQARWLSELLSKALGEPIPVRPVLALPGWMVERTGRGDVSVVNPKQLPALIREPRSQPTKAAVQRMHQIEFVLERLCRDVPFPGVTVAKEAKKAARKAFQNRKTNAPTVCPTKHIPRQPITATEIADTH